MIHALSFVLAVLLLAAAIAGLVFALGTRVERRRSRGLLVGSVVVGLLALALASAGLALRALIGSGHVEVIVVSPGAQP